MICTNQDNNPDIKVIDYVEKNRILCRFRPDIGRMYQQPAPVVVGNAGSGTSSNPYGATPYGTNAPAANDAPYTPPSAPAVNSSYTPPVSGGAYVPSYAPVDINAATHITQDNLREWNGLTDNNISIGQNLRVKPAGYTAPASTAAAKPSYSAPAPVAKPAPAPLNTPTVATGATRTVSGITWQRPVK